MRALLAAALAIAASPASAQPLPIRLSDGAAWTMTVERSRERQWGDAPPQAVTVKSSSALTWKRVGEAGELTAEITSTDAGAAEIAGALGLAHRPVRATVDPALLPERIENWDEVRDGLLEAIAKTVTEPKAAAAAQGVFAKLSAEQAAQVILRDQTLAAISQGSDLELGQPVDYDDLLPNPLGGPPIKSQGRFELVSYDPAKGQAVVTWRQTFDRASATASLAAAAEALIAHAAPEGADKVRAAFQGARIDRADTCRHEIDIPTGLAVRAVCDTTIDITVQGETAHNVDRWTITQSLPKTSP